MSDKMTNAELVEAVAREVMGWSGDIIHVSIDRLQVINDALVSFDPFTDMNDLFVVLEKFDWYLITRWCPVADMEKVYNCTILNKKGYPTENESTDKSLPRAVLEAALLAERSR